MAGGELSQTYIPTHYTLSTQVQIVGGPDIYVREGSSVTLECIVAEAPANSPVYIAWQFNRGDVPGSRVSVLGMSRLFSRVATVS